MRFRWLLFRGTLGLGEGLEATKGTVEAIEEGEGLYIFIILFLNMSIGGLNLMGWGKNSFQGVYEALAGGLSHELIQEACYGGGGGPFFWIHDVNVGILTR